MSATSWQRVCASVLIYLWHYWLQFVGELSDLGSIFYMCKNKGKILQKQPTNEPIKELTEGEDLTEAQVDVLWNI